LFIKHSENTGLRIIDESDSVIHRDLKPEWFDWVETGLKIHSRDIDIPVQRYYWVK
jgi:hypothetical protein